MRLNKTVRQNGAGLLQDALKAAAELPMEWDKHDDSVLRSRLQDLVRRIDRMRRLKSSGLAALTDSTRAKVEKLLLQLSNIGLFIVPVGELESWLAEFSIEASKANKWLWAEKAAGKIKEVGEQKSDVWAFVNQILGYFKASLAKA